MTYPSPHHGHHGGPGRNPLADLLDQSTPIPVSGIDVDAVIARGRGIKRRRRVVAGSAASMVVALAVAVPTLLPSITGKNLEAGQAAPGVAPTQTVAPQYVDSAAPDDASAPTGVSPMLPPVAAPSEAPAPGEAPATGGVPAPVEVDADSPRTMADFQIALPTYLEDVLGPLYPLASEVAWNDAGDAFAVLVGPSGEITVTVTLFDGDVQVNAPGLPDDVRVALVQKLQSALANVEPAT